jgi:hypothetical protein
VLLFEIFISDFNIAGGTLGLKLNESIDYGFAFYEE